MVEGGQTQIVVDVIPVGPVLMVVAVLPWVAMALARCGVLLPSPTETGVALGARGVVIGVVEGTYDRQGMRDEWAGVEA